MASLPYNTIATSKPFHILVGPNKKTCMVHSELLAQLSKPLNSLVNGEMKEASEGVAEWPTVDEETFVRFWEFAYTRDYTAPAPVFVPIPKAQTDYENEWAPHPPEDPEPEPPAEPYTEPEPERWGVAPSSRRRIKNRSMIQAPAPAKPSLWEQFSDLTLSYEVPLLSHLPRKEEMHPKTRLDHSEVFHSHARMYVLADYYDIEALMALSLKKLHQALMRFDLSEERIDDVTAVLGYCFENTVDKGEGQDRLRHLLTLYAACKVEIMWPSPAFQDLLERSGELSKAMIGYMINRLD